MSDLKPCPFCGGPAADFDGDISCTACGIALLDSRIWDLRAPRFTAEERIALTEAARIMHWSNPLNDKQRYITNLAAILRAMLDGEGT